LAANAAAGSTKRRIMLSSCARCRGRLRPLHVDFLLAFRYIGQHANVIVHHFDKARRVRKMAALAAGEE
jgi:hypothetical protein